MEEMKAVVYEGSGKYAVTTRPVPEIRQNTQMLVKVLAASLCSTDVHALDCDECGYEIKPGVIMGHIFVGEVVEAGSGCRFIKAGDKIISSKSINCGVCPACQLGNENVCSHIKTLGADVDGAFAQYIIMTEKQCEKIDSDVEVDDAIFAEPLNSAMGGIKKLKISLGDSVLILGGGPMGLYYTDLCKKCGAGKVFISEVSESRAPFAIQTGASRVINPEKENLHDVIMEETGNGVDIVIDAVGSLVKDALDCVRPAGQVLLFGMSSAKAQEIRQMSVTRNDVAIKGNYSGGNCLVYVAKSLNSGLINLRHLITHRFNIDNFDSAVEVMRDGSAMEVIIYPWGK